MCPYLQILFLLSTPSQHPPAPTLELPATYSTFTLRYLVLYALEGREGAGLKIAISFAIFTYHYSVLNGT